MDDLLDSLGLKPLYNEARRAIRKPRKALDQFIFAANVVLGAFVAWRCLMLITGCESPVVVVLSGSMEPGMYRGDVLLLQRPRLFSVGDIVVYKVTGRDIPIVHRILSVHQPAIGPAEYLTKGDNNNVDDRGLYMNGQLWLQDHEIIGKAIMYAPNLGMPTILLNDYPILKVGLLTVMGILLLLGYDF